MTELSVQSASPNTKFWSRQGALVCHDLVAGLANGLYLRKEMLLDVCSPTIAHLSRVAGFKDIQLIEPNGQRSDTSYYTIREKFELWTPGAKYQVVTCVHVLEYLPQPRSFARKLLKVGSTVIVVVPDAWPAGVAKGQIHDPITEEKLTEWFGRPPNFSYHCRELLTDYGNLVAVFEPNSDKWRTLGQRRKLREERNLLKMQEVLPGSESVV